MNRPLFLFFLIGVAACGAADRPASMAAAAPVASSVPVPPSVEEQRMVISTLLEQSEIESRRSVRR